MSNTTRHILLGTALSLSLAHLAQAADAVSDRAKDPNATIEVAQSDAAPPATADDSKPGDAVDGKVERVVVTARKRKERAFDVPGPVTVIGGDDLEKNDLNNAREFVDLIPGGFTNDTAVGVRKDFVVRGIGVPTEFAEPGVALYVDEAYAGGMRVNPPNFYDVERIEVLRGPQGGLYGRGAVGGAINIITRGPTDEFEGAAQVSIGRFERFQVNGLLNVPLSDDAGVRVAGWLVNQNEGRLYNPVLDTYIDDVESFGGRMTAAFDLGGSTSLKLIAEVSDDSGPQQAFVVPGNGDTKNIIRRDTSEFTDILYTRLTAQLNTDTGLGQFTGILGYRDYDLAYNADQDYSAAGTPRIIPRDEQISSWYGEARLLSPEGSGPISYLFGINFFSEDGRAILNSFLPSSPATANLLRRQAQTTDSFSAYGELTWALSDKFDVIGSLRYTHDEKNLDFLTVATAPIDFLSGAAVDSATFENLSPGMTLAYSVSPTLNLYARAQTGFRAGGYNFVVDTALIGELPYDEETSINYELGAKLQLWDGMAELDLSIYQLEQTDILIVFPAPAPTFGVLDNGGEGRTRGVELDFLFYPTDELRLQGNIAWMEGIITEAAPGSFAVANSNIPFIPPWSGSLMASWQKPIFDDVDLVTDLVYVYRGDVSGVRGFSTTLPDGGYSLINLRVGLAAEKWFVRGYLDNATDERYVQSESFNSTFAQPMASFNAGRTYGVTAGISF